jgi:glycosyltransferase involved in cell wall biosynthesis
VIYFNPYLETSIAEKMKMILENPKIREQFISNGIQHLKKFSWEKMAKETLAVYEEVLNKG